MVLRATAVVCAALSVAATTFGQDGGPIVVSPRPELEWFGLDDLEFALEFEYRRDEDRVKRRGESTERDVEERFREILDLAATGFVGHPNLLSLDVQGELWFTQRRVSLDSAAGSGSSDEVLYNVNSSGTFLQESIAPLTIYYFRNQSDINRVFGGTLDNRTTEAGARLAYLGEMFPTNFHAYRREQKQKDQAGTVDFDITRDTFEADGRGRLGERQQLWWDFTYDDIEERGDTPEDYDRSEVNATHTIEFGEDQTHHLRSNFHYYDETGDRDFERIRLLERLRSQHTENFSTWLDYTEDRFDRPETEQRRREVVLNYRHQLFESLVTTGSFGYDNLRVPTEDFRSEDLFADVLFDYTKRVDKGRFFAGLGLDISRLRESDLGGAVQVVDQAFAFDASGLIVINVRNVIESSIRITDITGLILYDQGADYTVLALVDRVEIRRVTGGAIAPLETVLIDYTIGPSPGGRTTTLTTTFDLRYTFEEGPLAGVSVYSTLFLQDEDRNSNAAFDDLEENSFWDIKYGVEYTRRKLYLRAEQRRRNDSDSDFDLTRLEGRYTERFGRSNSLIFNALFQEINRPDEDSRSSTATFSANWNQQLTQNLRGNLVVLYQNDDNRGGGVDSEAFEQELWLTWRRGQTEMYARLRNSIRDSDEDDTTFQTIHVGIRREF